MREAIIIFTRVPVAGKTKTRLEAMISPEECAQLHRCFLRDLKRLCEDSGRKCFVFYTPYGMKRLLYPLLGEDKTYLPQKGKSLGERMHNAIEHVLGEGYDSCVLTGTDIPELERADIVQAFNCLRECDVVFGPTSDYGYYLVGMKKPCIEIFNNQTYGYGSVLRNTIEAAKSAGLSYRLINAHMDIDEPEDLFSLKNRIDTGEYDRNTHTAKYIEYLVKEYEDIWTESVDCENM